MKTALTRLGKIRCEFCGLAFEDSRDGRYLLHRHAKTCFDRPGLKPIEFFFKLGDPIPTELEVLESMRKMGNGTRGELMKRTGIPRSTIYEALMKLIARGLVEKQIIYKGGGTVHRPRGRPNVNYVLKERSENDG